MTEEKKQPNEELKQFLNEVPAGEIKAVERKLIEAAKTTPYIFRNWRLGITKVPLLERSVMNTVSNELYNKTIFNYPTNEDIHRHTKTNNRSTDVR